MPSINRKRNAVDDPTRDQLSQIINEFAVGSYRMFALRNIETAIVRPPTNWDHPFRDLMLDPTQDAFPRALVVLSHATLEGAMRNIGRARHVNRKGYTPWKADYWSLSTLRELDKHLQCCRLPDLTDVLERNALEGLIERRHSIVHRADYPITQESIQALQVNLFSWVGAAVFVSKRLIVQAFPTVANVENVDLAATLNLIEGDWLDLISSLSQRPATPPAA
jgi:hypothetical protein